MRFKGIENHNCTNSLIKWTVIMIDFVVLWILIPHMVEFIPHSEEWNNDKYHMLWMICTLSMVISEYWFYSTIHERLVGASDILQRCMMLVLAQTTLSYLLLRSIHFRYHLGWQLFFMGVAMLAIITLIRFAERWALKRLRALGYNIRRVTFIGSDQELQRLHQKLLSNSSYGYKLRSSYASLNDFASLLNHPEDLHLGDEVYLCAPHKERMLIEHTANLCQHKMKKFYYIPTAEEKLNLRSIFIDDMEIQATYTSPLEEPLNRLMKRAEDIFFAILFLIPTILLLPFIVLMIKLQSSGPAIFSQKRTGLNGRVFNCYKFRSMCINTEADSQQATKDDPRKFPFGNFLRRNSIDELPQFWNVLIGDMSFVGPRPHMLSHTEQYNQLIDKYMVRHFVKPGITGWAQVTGFRGETKELSQMEGRVERDIWYIQHWSLWLDIRIIWMTLKLLLKKDEKAY